ncbi:2-amino-4-hydroxy-6-hydroxymethyldihydropteridine diphosphokinase [Cryobacterium sp. CG_9.6]|uniref:2-amino-4-hydroxy-6- hydroxymethyldihydropteridine diphosphokinase n=1 Tax=Cryobacterium sp. CG_9.6 TaxID=2760710 RepID=UPI0024759634|nr:2-amino-4-hydroxy-6-hydroxymethyldihydropteridine diphosphokinase [Cryobacterium sp. CG_9.6]MDH6238256.1 2-amino-4-hydroxy-6-hydroxymethyldihydropteridine diphosphokinase [Cryobacterium sp. CG_9.6]
MPTHVVLALGSNLGDGTATLEAAVRALRTVSGLDIEGVSPNFESAAVKLHGVDDTAPRYINSVVTGRFTGDALELLDAVNLIEATHGRVRAERWGDRTLDIDIIAIDGLELDTARLTLPHPRAWERDFVLAPWFSLEADAVIPGRGSVRDLLAATENTAVPVAAVPVAGTTAATHSAKSGPR